eukprot:TRINITY_DN10603_c0_g1_i1.p2 TRINITY_DN10603_c0_g1~~TRINITY_DN10603_c0_g1_i1.p2  ORF type:complete len:100 (-),score=29.50 TRINITY_DN10603_c0_g1_i1:328-627(-)
MLRSLVGSEMCIRDRDGTVEESDNRLETVSSKTTGTYVVEGDGVVACHFSKMVRMIDHISGHGPGRRCTTTTDTDEYDPPRVCRYRINGTEAEELGEDP